MTTYFDEKVRCGVCGHISKQTKLGSTNQFGSPDLDLRPPEMMRSTIYVWVVRCPQCGYCAPDLAKSSDAAKAAVADAVYQATLGDEAYPELANRFRAYARIADADGQALNAAWSFIHAAWACDDARCDATDCRIEAAERLGRLVDAGALEPEVRQTQALVRLDLLRRAGRWAEAGALASQLADAPLPEFPQQIVAFQRRLIERQDSTCHPCAEAVPEGTPQRRPPQPSSEFKAHGENDARACRERTDKTAPGARALFAQVERSGWTCTHCGVRGGAEVFRLSIGPESRVICRQCGWPQEKQESR